MIGVRGGAVIGGGSWRSGVGCGCGCGCGGERGHCGLANAGACDSCRRWWSAPGSGAQSPTLARPRSDLRLWKRCSSDAELAAPRSCPCSALEPLRGEPLEELATEILGVNPTALPSYSFWLVRSAGVVRQGCACSYGISGPPPPSEWGGAILARDSSGSRPEAPTLAWWPTSLFHLSCLTSCGACGLPWGIFNFALLFEIARPHRSRWQETIRFDVSVSVLERLLAHEGGSWIRNVCARTRARIQAIGARVRAPTQLCRGSRLAVATRACSGRASVCIYFGCIGACAARLRLPRRRLCSRSRTPGGGGPSLFMGGHTHAHTLAQPL